MTAARRREAYAVALLGFWALRRWFLGGCRATCTQTIDASPGTHKTEPSRDGDAPASRARAGVPNRVGSCFPSDFWLFLPPVMLSGVVARRTSRMAALRGNPQFPIALRLLVAPVGQTKRASRVERESERPVRAAACCHPPAKTFQRAGRLNFPPLFSRGAGSG